MRRLAATMRLDARLQARNGFYYAAAFVAGVIILAASFVPDAYLAWVLPAIVFENMIVGTFYFMGGLVLLEKREGTLEAQVVTPLRAWEFLASKTITLTALALAENLAIVTLAYGAEWNVVAMTAGILVAAPLFSLAGFVFVARYDSINEYLMPSVLVTTVLTLPILSYAGVLDGAWLALHPMNGALELMRAAFEPTSAATIAFAVLYSALWLAILFVWSRRAYGRFVVAKERRYA
jgi:fluoroquinolone transport system permease protein